MKNIVCLTVFAAAFCFAANLFAEEATAAAPVAKTTVTVAPGAGCPCASPCAVPNPCDPCACPPVVYRVGLFGHIRPVVYAPPVYRPYYYRYAYPYYPRYYW